MLRLVSPLLLLLLFTPILWSQTDCPGDPFALYYEEANVDVEGVTVVQDGDEFYVGGSVDGKLLIIKISIDGSIIWQTRVEGISDDLSITDLEMDLNGDLIGCGRYFGSGTAGAAVKLDIDGNIIWAREYESSPIDFRPFEIIDPNPNVPYTLLGGTNVNPNGRGCDATWWQIDRDNGDLIPTNSSDFHLGSCETFTAAINIGGNYYATGRFNFAGGGQSRFRPALTVIDPNGNLTLSRLYLVDVNTDARLYSTDIVQKGSNLGLAIYGDPDGIDPSTEFAWIIQANLTGGAMFGRRYTLPENVATQEIEALSDGYLLLSRSTESETQYLIRTDNLGQVIWARSYENLASVSSWGDNLIVSDDAILWITTDHSGPNKRLAFLRLDADGVPDIECVESTLIDIEELQVSSPYDGFNALEEFATPFEATEDLSGEAANLVLSDTSCPLVCEPDDCENAPEPVVDLGPDLNLCTDTTIVLDAGTGFVSYLWQDNSDLQTLAVSSSGVYSVMVTDSCGKTATDSVMISFGDAFMTMEEIDICEGDIIDIFGVPQSTPGEYTQTFIATNGCDSTHTVTLNVNPNFETEEAISICEGESIIIFGVEQSAAGTFIGSFVAQNGCDSTHTVLLTINPNSVTEETISICDGESATIFGEEQIDAGVYSQDFTAVNGCDSTHSVTLIVNPVEMTQALLSICEGETIDIFGEQIGIAGIYSATFQTSLGCDSTHTIDLFVAPLGMFEESVDICEGESFNLNGQSLTEPGEYAVTLVGANGCDSIYTVILDVLPPVFTQESLSICEGQSIEIFGQNQSTAGDYSATFTAASGCDSIHTISLSIIEELTSSEDITICEGESVIIFGQNIDEAGSYSQTFMTSEGCDSTHTVNLTVIPVTSSTEIITICPGETAIIFGQEESQPGFYFNTIDNGNGCESTQVVQLIITNLDLVVLQAVEQCTGSKMGAAGAIIAGGTEPYSFIWSNGGTTQIITDLPAGNYSVTVTDANGCTIVGNVDIVP